jgi:hypothetical protein
MFEVAIFKVGLLIIFGLLVLEQLFYSVKGSYVYRYGIKIKSLNLEHMPWNIITKTHHNLSIKNDRKKEEVYIKYYRRGVGWDFFVGQIRYHDQKKSINIRMGYITFIILSLLIMQIIYGVTKTELIILSSVYVFVYLNYRRLYSEIWNIINPAK